MTYALLPEVHLTWHDNGMLTPGWSSLPLVHVLNRHRVVTALQGQAQCPAA